MKNLKTINTQKVKNGIYSTLSIRLAVVKKRHKFLRAREGLRGRGEFRTLSEADSIP